MSEPCRVPVYRESGYLYGSKVVGAHDWRLLSRERAYTFVSDAPPSMSIKQKGWIETWYCTRCRFVDTVETEEEEE